MVPCATMQRALALRATLADLDLRPVVPGQCAAGFALFLVTPGTVAGPKFVLGGDDEDWAARWTYACQWWEAQDAFAQLEICARHVQHTEHVVFGRTQRTSRNRPYHVPPLRSCCPCNTAPETAAENCLRCGTSYEH